MSEKDVLIIQCPRCGQPLETPYVFDGTYEIFHQSEYTFKGKKTWGCEESFYIAILDGKLHVHKTQKALETMLEKLRQ